MKNKDLLKFAIIAAALPAMVYVINLMVPIDLRQFGIRPRATAGLWGIACAPLLHGNIDHLLANTGALFVLMLVALTFSPRLTQIALMMIIVLGGLLVWIFGNPNTVHIGASGVIFGLLGFLMFIGIFRREWLALFLSIVIFVCYGGALLSLLAPVAGVSWTGHLFGFLSGAFSAWWTKSHRSQ